MKLNDLVTEKQEKEQPGTYAALKFSPESVDKIMEYIKSNDIPNKITKDKLHVTLLYSRKYCPNYNPPKGKLDTPYTCHPGQFKVWKTRSPDPSKQGWDALVMQVECPELVQHHKDLMKEHKATYDFDKYEPHFTLSYNIEDLKISTLPSFKDVLKLDEEYKTDLDLNWVEKQGTKNE